MARKRPVSDVDRDPTLGRQRTAKLLKRLRDTKKRAGMLKVEIVKAKEREETSHDKRRG